MVSDCWRDISARSAPGCRKVFIDYSYENDPRPERPDLTVHSLAEAIPLLLRRA